jgi:diaminohydroxyphosphoribosylaminopyrimidine deaminase/5-amino-6-(5-phosphoribosylamino)uracil reductase
MADVADTDFMKLAIDLAEKGRGKTSPNPVVGAVLVHRNRVVGKGYHRAAGRDHAEIAAIKMAGSKARGATLYVNLEPCCHQGRTGPCTEAIIKAGISRVVASTKDPNPVVDGKGFRLLRKAGVKVETGLLKKQARQLNDIYIGYHENKRPYVILKLAQSLDGRIATGSGDSRWISSPQSRRFVHKLRAEVDAVVVGAGTVRRDNPLLTVRHVRGENPYRIVLSESLKIPPRSNLLVHNGDFKTIIASSDSALSNARRVASSRNPITWTVDRAAKHQLDLEDFMMKVNQFGLRSILVEGGRELATAFLKAGLVDKIVMVTAPIIIGDGISGIGELNIRNISKAIKLESGFDIGSGVDTIHVGYPQGAK